MQRSSGHDLLDAQALLILALSALKMCRGGLLSFGIQTLTQRTDAMAVPSPTPVHTVSNADLASALKQIGAEIDHHPLHSSVLARIMRDRFGGSDASGAWDWRMAYDMMQATAVRQLMHRYGADEEIEMSVARLLATRLLTQQWHFLNPDISPDAVAWVWPHLIYILLMNIAYILRNPDLCNSIW